MNQKLSRVHIEDYLACKRRYQLRYLSGLPWPEDPYEPEKEHAFAQGREFHLLAERHFSGLPVDTSAVKSDNVRLWWQAFQPFAGQLPTGKRLVEFALTVPFNGHRLTGIFDLLIFGEGDAGRPQATLYDWKTSRPLSDGRLLQAWQTRLYLALLIEGQAGLPLELPAPLRPEDITFTYWFADEPDRPRNLPYSTAQHDRTMQELLALTTALDANLQQDSWPLTDDWDACRYCAYGAYCGRQEAGHPPPAVLEEDNMGDAGRDETLEPAY